MYKAVNSESLELLITRLIPLTSEAIKLNANTHGAGWMGWRFAKLGWKEHIKNHGNVIFPVLYGLMHMSK